MSGRHRGLPGGRRGRGPVAAGLLVLALAVVGVAVGVWAHGSDNGPRPATRSHASQAATRRAVTPPSSSATRPADQPWLAPPAAGTVGHLRAGSNPAVLPAPLLIADKLNNRLIIVDPQGRVRWQFPRPGDLTPGQHFEIPDDAFFSPDGRYIIATQEDRAVITVIDIAQHRIVYRYGIPGHPGMRANQLSNPDDAMLLPNHYILTADIKNCRLLLIAPGAHRPARILGRTTSACLHQPPYRWGSPNGMFPMTNSHYLVTEINGDWVDEIDLHGHVYWSAHPPGVAYPSDANEIGPDRYLTVDYSEPGQVVIFNRAGRRLWSYSGHSRDRLDHPSLALPLPNGDIVLNDDYNHRVIVIDPHTDKIVWQYGVTGTPGSRPGYLNNPDGIDLAPSQSLLIIHRRSMARSVK